MVEEAKTLEREAVDKAETGYINKAIELFNKSIQLAPKRPSGYNNRAQAYRLKGDILGSIKNDFTIIAIKLHCTLVFMTILINLLY